MSTDTTDSECLEVTAVQFVNDYKLRLTFTDGSFGVADLQGLLHGPAFQAVRNPVMFAQAFLDTELGTVAWPTGADLAPEALRELLSASVT